MKKTRFKSILILLLFTAGCGKAFVPSRAIKIPPYIIEYYHYDDPEKPTDDERESGGWYGYKWEDGFQMNFKIARVEESGIYFYRLIYRAINPWEEKVTLYDQNIELLNLGTSLPIERVKCWNWQKVSYPCNLAEIDPEEEIKKEIRFGYSINERHAGGLKVHIGGLSFEKGEVIIDFYAKKD